MHTHILPQMDDGADADDISVMLLDNLESQGVTHLALTSHYYSHRDDLNHFLARRNAAYKQLMLSYDGNIKLYLGSEVYLTEELFNNENLFPLCYNKSRYMLTELPYDSEFNENTIGLLNRLIEDYSVMPVLAHVERYSFLMKGLDNINALVRMGCIVQVNVNSFCDFFVRRKLLALAQNKLIHVIGTDTHSFVKGSDYITGYNIAVKKAGAEFVNKCFENSLKILENKQI